MKKIILMLAFILCWRLLPASEAVFPPLTGPVVDTANMLKADEINSLSQKLISFQKEKGSQIAVCIVPTVAPLAIEDYGIQLAQKWKIGRAKISDGVIIIIAKNDRKMRIETGYGVEHVVTDLMAGRIVDRIMAPEFRKGEFYKGIDASVDALITSINGGDIPSLSASGKTSDIGSKQGSNSSGAGIGLLIASIIIFFILAAKKKAALSLLPTYPLFSGGLYFLGAGTPGISALIGLFSMLPFAFIAIMMKISHGSSGYSSSSSSSGSSYSSSSSSSSDSSSSGSDSYSGGGGDFGGGGASGDW